MIYILHKDIQPLALGCPDGAVFQTQVTDTIIVLGRNCGNAGTGMFCTISGPLDPFKAHARHPLHIQVHGPCR
jgi:hypothetical protein